MAYEDNHATHKEYDRRCELCIVEYREAGIAANLNHPELWGGYNPGPEFGWPQVKRKGFTLWTLMQSQTEEELEEHIELLRHGWREQQKRIDKRMKLTAK